MGPPALPPTTVIEVGETVESFLARLEGGKDAQGGLRPTDLAAMLCQEGLPTDFLFVRSMEDACGTAGFNILVQGYRYVPDDPHDGREFIFDDRDLEDENIFALPAGVRSRTIAVLRDERHHPTIMTEHGFLGVISHSGWRSWANGLMGAKGIYGHEDIARAAGLDRHAVMGWLRGKRVLELPTLLAQYLRAAAISHARS
jgi:hypothetical protein